MCWGPHISWWMLPGSWSSVWEISRLIETAGRPTVLPSFSASTSFSLIQLQGSAASVHRLVQKYKSESFSCLLNFLEA
jgi:hypothetical protein